MAIKDPSQTPEKKTTTKTTTSSGAAAKKNQKTKQSFEDRAEQASERAEESIQATAAKVEAKMDKVAADLTKKVKASVSPELEQKAKRVANQLDSVAGKVEDVVNEIWSFIPDPNKTHSHSWISLNAKFSGNVSRLFIFRFLWLIIQIPVMYIWSIWILFINILQWLHMLILGTRNASLWNKTYRYLSHTTKRNAFISWFIDEQPKIIEDLPK